MAQDAKFERWLWRSVVKHLQNHSAMAGVEVRLPGTATPPTRTLEEWVRVRPLAFDRRPSRAGEWIGRPRWEVRCYSKRAELRADKQTDAALNLAGKVRAALEHAAVAVLKIGETPETEVTRLTFGEGQITGPEDVPDEGTLQKVTVTFHSALAVS